MLMSKKKALFLGLFYILAGEERIELSIMVLETIVMPFNYSPTRRHKYLICAFSKFSD